MSVDILREHRTSTLAFNTWMPVLCCLAFCIIALTLIVTQDYPGYMDELEHVSYAAFLQETGRWLPKFELQKTLVIADMGQWQDRANYLGHPSPFYLFIGRFLDRSLPPFQAILPLRLASAALVLTGVILALLAGRRHFMQDRLAAPVFCLLLALCPALLAISGQVTNDSLAFLGGALAYWGASTADRRRWLGLGGIVPGLVFVLWAKPNAGMAVGIWLGTFALLRGLIRTPLTLAIALGLAVGSIPYLFILRDYGALVPVTGEQFGHYHVLDSFARYLPAFLVNIGYTWSFSRTGTWPITSWAGLIAPALFWMMIACAAVGGVAGINGVVARGRLWTPRDAIAAAGVVAFAVVLPIHLWFSATRLGFSLPAASFRYYLPIWPVLVHALAYSIAIARNRWRRVLVASISVAALIVGWVSPV